MTSCVEFSESFYADLQPLQSKLEEEIDRLKILIDRKKNVIKRISEIIADYDNYCLVDDTYLQYANSKDTEEIILGIYQTSLDNLQPIVEGLQAL